MDWSTDYYNYQPGLSRLINQWLSRSFDLWKLILISHYHCKYAYCNLWSYYCMWTYMHIIHMVNKDHPSHPSLSLRSSVTVKLFPVSRPACFRVHLAGLKERLQSRFQEGLHQTPNIEIIPRLRHGNYFLSPLYPPHEQQGAGGATNCGSSGSNFYMLQCKSRNRP
jgi:hypothetical protein